MMYFSKAKIIGVGLILALGLLFALPNFLSPRARLAIPNFLPSGQLNLGLDLQGGSHLLLEVDTKTIARERLENLVSDMRGALRTAKIGYTGLGIAGNGVGVTILRASDMERARQAVQALAQPISDSLFAARADYDLRLAVSGNSLRVTLTDAAVEVRNRRAVQQSIEIIRRRIDELGTTEPTIQRQGARRVLVQVPGLNDPERLKALIGQTAKLNFHLLDESVSPYEAAQNRRQPIGTRLVYSIDAPQIPYLIKRRVMVSGERLVDASIGFDPQTSAPQVNFRFDSVGGRQFGKVTQANIGRPFAIVLDDKVISAPVIQSAILGGSGRITGSFTVQAANDLAILLRAGALPAPLSILEERTVGPGLGADSVAAGRIALIIGFAAVIIFIALSYNLFGLFANAALVLNLLLIMGVLSALQATLTLPGIAGIVLTVGMAVDANVLIFERIREELAANKSPIQAMDAGYSRALGTILDANITTLLAALILFQIGSGPIRGFAVTLAIGVVTSVFTAVTVTRLFIVLWFKRRKPATIPI